MKRFIPTLVLLAVVVTPLLSQGQSALEQRTSLTSGINYYTTNYGPFGNNVRVGNPGFSYPRDTGAAYIFGSGLWFGARKNVNISKVDTVNIVPLRLSFVGYDQTSGQSWGTPGTWSSVAASTGTLVNRLAYAPDYDRTTGEYLGGGTASPGWPLWSDTEEPVNLRHPGRYVIDSAARTAAISGAPAFVDGVAEQFVSRYHDGNLAAYGSAAATSYPIGLQIEQNIYSFAEPGLDNTVILHYQVINVSGDTLRECYAGKMIDADILTSANDHVAYYAARPELATAVAWSESENFGYTIGTLLMTMLESPAVDEAGYIRHDRRDYDSSEQTGLGTFQNVGLVGTPENQAERYDFMSMGDLDGDNGAGDKYALLATRPFNMLPGDTARFAVAYTVVLDLPEYEGGSNARIEAAADRVISLYRSGSTSAVPSRPAPSGALSIGRIHPNPATSRVAIDIHLERMATTSIRMTDQLGRVVLEREARTMEAGDHTVALDVAGISPGLYIVTVESAGAVRSGKMVISR